jgi:hypothetical protein
MYRCFTIRREAETERHNFYNNMHRYRLAR